MAELRQCRFAEVNTKSWHQQPGAVYKLDHTVRARLAGTKA